MACNRNPETGVVQGLDTYNEAENPVNVVDPQQNVVQFSANYSDGRIKCRYFIYCQILSVVAVYSAEVGEELLNLIIS